MPSKDRHINFALIRDRVLSRQGKEYWRSLEEFSGTDEFREFVEREYPQHAEEWDDPVERRTFLKLMGASLALAGLSGCVYQPPESIVPYVTQPEEFVPGKPLFFATAFTLGGIATGLLAKSNEGRPTKLEGNPDHPASLGATDLFAQASLLTLYDPDRSQSPYYRETERPWTTFLKDIRQALDEQKGKQGAGLRILTETVTSPTLGNQIRGILAEYPSAKWYQYEPAARHNARAGAEMAFGQAVNTLYRFELAERVLSLDADFLTCGAGVVRHVRDFIAKRRVDEGKTAMNRLYMVESTPTLTGAKADHRLSLRPSEIEPFARAVATALGANTGGSSSAPAYTAHANWIAALARDLQANRGKCIVVAGDEQSPAVHALAHAMNETLGNVGQTIFYTDPVEFESKDQIAGLRELVADMDAGRVEMLVMVGGNPVYNAPADLRFDKARLDKVKLRVHLSLYKDETSELCHWHIPESHYLEAWSDARSNDGTVSIVQPLIEPLYKSKSAHEFLAAFSTATDRTGYDIVRAYWQGQRMGAVGQGTGDGQGQTSQAGAQASASPAAQSSRTTSAQSSPAPAAQAASSPAASPAAQASTAAAPPAAPTQDFEAAWRKVLHDGLIPNTAFQPRTGLSVKGDWAKNAGSGTPAPSPQPPSPNQIEIIFRTDPTIYDGRFSNNGWLQELPKPITKLTWDNAALVSPNTAQRLGLVKDIGSKGGNIFVDTVTLKLGGNQTSKPVPVWVMPGQPDNVVTVHLGYGRRRAGRVGNDAGFNAYEIRTSNALWSGSGLEITKTGERYQLATTQLHFTIVDDRDIIREKKLVDYLNESDEKHREEKQKHEQELKDLSMYPEFEYKEYKWGMAIDISSCVGCSACVVACQSENNIPIVGKAQVERSREMHWLRIDTYFKGKDENNPEGMNFMPVPCMHCENAPCEPVCPVHATVHSSEGLNDMVYNRCVGTRYCSNNCPYKVRRFNFLLYQDWNTPTYKLMRNPEVTVRSRGVMEKCTYCVQRIQNAKIESEKDGRKVRDGEIVTACQAVCPAEAIVFGDINDPNSRVHKLKKQQRNYSLLEELNTQPRTTYLASLRNPNPEIEKEKA
ncbi:MAG: TAT-variant-translocated molybdopterin oxidoreductase [Pyrinomonadaceae bacterium]|nr:TAT-variant-translocated molybdopterin oxidoreductase [Pyrinomonadaceae bacterium]